MLPDQVITITGSSNGSVNVCGVAALNVCLWLIWPVSLVGILIQAAAEEKLLRERFGQDYERYVRRTGRLVPRLATP